MQIALFSDIHGNLTALEAVLEAIPRLGGADLCIAAGDLLVGESAADEIVELLQARHVRMVRGDSDTDDKLDHLIAQQRTAPGTTRNSLAYYEAMREWLLRHRSEACRTFLAGLPTELTVTVEDGRRLYVCHASPRSVGDRICAPQVAASDVRAVYGVVDADVIAFGHAHTPFVRLQDGRLHINVASVGFRADGLARLTLLTAQPEQWLVAQHAVPFDIAREQQRMRERQVPFPEL
jgi:predicted phosphodiesterase